MFTDPLTSDPRLGSKSDTNASIHAGKLSFLARRDHDGSYLQSRRRVTQPTGYVQRKVKLKTGTLLETLILRIIEPRCYVTALQTPPNYGSPGGKLVVGGGGNEDWEERCLGRRRAGMSWSRLRERINVEANRGLGRHEKGHKEENWAARSSERSEEQRGAARGARSSEEQRGATSSLDGRRAFSIFLSYGAHLAFQTGFLARSPLLLFFSLRA